MLHYGDITKLSGYELPVVDVIPVWSSEIEKHAQAVARYHFPEVITENAEQDD